MKTCNFHVLGKVTCDVQESKFKIQQNTIIFILCALEFQNTKDKILETHHGDKPHNTKILEPCSHEIEFQQYITNYKKILTCNKYLTTHPSSKRTKHPQRKPHEDFMLYQCMARSLVATAIQCSFDYALHQISCTIHVVRRTLQLVELGLHHFY